MVAAKDRWLRRQAVQLSGQLPEDVDEARRVIGYMEEIVDRFLAPQKELGEPLRFVANTGSRRNRPMPS